MIASFWRVPDVALSREDTNVVDPTRISTCGVATPEQEVSWFGGGTGDASAFAVGILGLCRSC
jgi:hypothetical protein